MSNAIDNSKQAGVEKGGGLWKKAIPVLTLLLAISITVALFLYRDRVIELKDYVYLGAFLISLASNATVILPLHGPVILASLGAILYKSVGIVGPVYVGLAGGAAAPIGEITGYMVGYSGRGIIERNKLYSRLVGWVKRWGAMAIFVFSLVPFFPFDLAGIAAGVLRFPLWKFFLVCWLGRTILYIGVALAGAWGWEAMLRYLG